MVRYTAPKWVPEAFVADLCEHLAIANALTLGDHSPPLKDSAGQDVMPASLAGNAGKDVTAPSTRRNNTNANEATEASTAGNDNKDVTAPSTRGCNTNANEVTDASNARNDNKDVTAPSSPRNPTDVNAVTSYSKSVKQTLLPDDIGRSLSRSRSRRLSRVGGNTNKSVDTGRKGSVHGTCVRAYLQRACVRL